MLDILLHLTNEQVFGGLPIATAVILGISHHAAKRDLGVYGDVLCAAQLLTVILGLSVICRTAAPPGGVGNMIWLSVVDLVGLMASAYWFITKPRAWAFVLVFTFIAELCAHAGFWRGWFSGNDTRIAHIVCLNILAVLQLIAVGWPGVSHVARELSAVLSHRGRGRVPLGHGAHQ